MKKTVSYLLVLLLSGSLAWAADSVNSLAEVSDQTRFSRDRVTAELSLPEIGKEGWKLQRAQRGGLSLNNRSRARWLMISGVATMVVGLTLMATSTEEITGIDPFTGQQVTFEQVRRGRRLAGISFLAGGGFLMTWSSMQ